jgi:hypothetical protein
MAASVGVSVKAAFGGSSTREGCDASIDQFPVTTGGSRSTRLVLNRVWLPKSSVVLQWPRTPNLNGNDRFLKWGVIVSVGSPVELMVPSSSQDRYALHFGTHANTVADAAKAVTFVPCGKRNGRWTGWVGGYIATKPACVPLLVRVGSQSERVSLSLGHRCSA